MDLAVIAFTYSFCLIKKKVGGWKGGSVVKSTCYFCCRRPRFNSWHPPGGSQAFITPVPGDTRPSFWLLQAPGMHVTHIHIHMQEKTLIYIKI